ncbi:GatB/YqeY domain-containing protein [Bacteroidota bacterium]
MSLETTINEEIKNAMRAKDKVTLEALRAVKSAILLAKTEKGGSDKLSGDVEMKLLQKLVKQRKDSAEIYKEQGRNELYQKEVDEIKVIEKFLPEQMSEEELIEVLKSIIAQTGASSPAEMGKVMGIATKQLAGKADGKAIAVKVKELLSK